MNIFDVFTIETIELMNSIGFAMTIENGHLVDFFIEKAP